MKQLSLFGVVCISALCVGCHHSAPVTGSTASARPEAPSSVAGKTFVYYPQTHTCNDTVCDFPEHKQPWSLTWLNSNERKEAPVGGWHASYQYVKNSATEATVYWLSTNDEIGNNKTMHLHFSSPTGGTASFEVDHGWLSLGWKGTGTFTLK